MNCYRFDCAIAGDDGALRRLLAETPMPGSIPVSFRREPSFFGAVRVEGRWQQVLVARQQPTGRVVGVALRNVNPAYINGEPSHVGYLSSLRLLAPHRSGTLVARGYRYLHTLHQDQRAGLYLTTIAEGNEQAERLLTSGRAGLPAYHFQERFHTLVIPTSRRPVREMADCTVRPLAAADLPDLVALLQREGSRRQFFPCYDARDFLGPDATFQGLCAEQILGAFADGELIGSLAGWDQRAFRQTVVEAYPAWLSVVRPWVNLCARIGNRPTLPKPGAAFPYLTAALPVVRGNQESVFASLLQHLRHRAAMAGHSFLVLGLSESDPLLPTAVRWKALRYVTKVYIVCWPDGEAQRRALDRRPLYLELGRL